MLCITKQWICNETTWINGSANFQLEFKWLKCCVFFPLNILESGEGAGVYCSCILPKAKYVETKNHSLLIPVRCELNCSHSHSLSCKSKFTILPDKRFDYYRNIFRQITSTSANISIDHKKHCHYRLWTKIFLLVPYLAFFYDCHLLIVLCILPGGCCGQEYCCQSWRM